MQRSSREVAQQLLEREVASQHWDDWWSRPSGARVTGLLSQALMEQANVSQIPVLMRQNVGEKIITNHGPGAGQLTHAQYDCVKDVIVDPDEASRSGIATWCISRPSTGSCLLCRSGCRQMCAGRRPVLFTSPVQRSCGANATRERWYSKGKMKAALGRYCDPLHGEGRYRPTTARRFTASRAPAFVQRDEGQISRDHDGSD
jgi:hypothetical protein